MSQTDREILISRIKERLAALGITANAASTKAGSASLIPNILYGRSGYPRFDTLERIATVLETSIEYLTAKTDDPRPNHLGSDIPVAGIPLPAKTAMPEDLPVRGTAAGSTIHTANGEDFEGLEVEANVIQYVRRPPALMTVKEAYAIYVQGDSMHPMHSEGALRFINPFQPPAAGDTVLVQTRSWDDAPGQAYIKIYRRRASGKLILEQLNPAATLHIPLEYVHSIHKVLDMNELFGV